MSSCLICNSEVSIEKTINDRNGINIQIIKCTSCGHQFQPSENFEDIYSTGDFSEIHRGTELPSKKKIEQLDSRALKRLEFYSKYLLKGASCLEIGSSVGSFLNLMKQTNKTVIGLEPDPAYCSHSRKLYGFDQFNTIIEDFKWKSKFDLLVSFHVIEHVKNPKVFAAKCAENLSEGGQLIIECPSMEINSFNDYKTTFWQPHTQYFNAASIYLLFAPFFIIEEIGYYGSAIFIAAKRSENASIDDKLFKRYKSQAKKIQRINQILPSFKYKNHNLKHFLVRSLIERDTGYTNKVKFFGKYFLKERSYVKKEKAKKANGIAAYHLTYFRGWENTGDTVLSKCVREVFDVNGSKPFNWSLSKVTNEVNNSLIEKINKNKVLVIGGGGLFLPDTNPNSKSGWQWAASKEDIDAINIPIVLYAVGYNYFTGQNPDEFFLDNLKYILQKASFVGLRNYGSIKKVSELANEHVNKISFQPCPTTIIRNNNPWLDPKIKTKNVGVNIAFDRYHLRFGERMTEILCQIAEAIKKIETFGYKIFLIGHLKTDLRFKVILDRMDIKYESILLQYYLPDEVYNFYNTMEVVLGMRGHAQMIPFGLNCKIITLSSHEKMKYFLRDIDAEDWLVDLKGEESGICDRILLVFNNITSNSKSVNEKLIVEQKKFLDITNDNYHKHLSSLFS